MPPLLSYRELRAAAFPGKPLNAGAGMEDAPSLVDAGIIPPRALQAVQGMAGRDADLFGSGGSSAGFAQCHSPVPSSREGFFTSSPGCSRLQAAGSPGLSLLRHEREGDGESRRSQMSPLKNPAKRVEIPCPGLKQGGPGAGMSLGLIPIKRGQEEPEPTWPPLLFASDDPGSESERSSPAAFLCAQRRKLLWNCSASRPGAFPPEYSPWMCGKPFAVK